ncbi:MAG: hydrolase TatD [Candidatus Zambryskibacteria bacterium CG11_big_fil_rev_8_21_14_0_20_40_24]|uniref:Hydrolase TatD n=1 Tax=Candidatus Zambryskibacteria bacterium CG11_big_fil_rev_8_21_14_0_20_40_24 TaxID=1975116 RepID=A0A2H0K7E6_9BACT|nr:MAG: hydrolase TatD [Candidatus Zambryskibacteria bacterium CG11_big_fil_rev_8_21_14_0_20_40_24]
MIPEFFDIHSHLNFPDYGDELLLIINRMEKNGVWTTVVGTDLKTSKEALVLAEKHEGIFACVGVHPVDEPQQNFDELEFEKLVAHPKVVAVGECGLDYFRIDQNDIEEKERQKNLFIKHILFAIKHDKPLMIHSRSAYDDLIDILQFYKKENSHLLGNVHFFSGNLEQAKKFIAMDFTISFAGPITFAHDYDEVIRSVPETSILSETDSPFASPVPHRGRRNEPSFVIEVAKKIAQIRGEDEEKTRKILVNNALKLFKIH